MIFITELGETIATTIEDIERTKRGIDSALGSIYRFNVFTDVIIPDDSYLLVQRRQIGSAFILGHGINAKLGTQTPQPVLGSSTSWGNWVTIAEYTGTTAP